MTKRVKVCGRLDRIIREGVSYYGNPHYWIVVVTTEGEVIYGKTCVNGAIGYGLTNGGVGENARIREGHTTRRELATSSSTLCRKLSKGEAKASPYFLNQ